jgi:hypothetical protein
MPLGPGTYDDITTDVRERVGGEVALLVINGAKGSGFSVQATLATTVALPAMLRSMADQIEAGLRQRQL